MHDTHRLEWDADLVRGDLGERRLVALTVRRLAGEYGHVTIDLEPYPRLLGHRGRHADGRKEVGRPRREFHQVAHANPKQSTGFTRAPLLFAEGRVADAFEGAVHRLALRQLRNVRTGDHRCRQVARIEQV